MNYDMNELARSIVVCYILAKIGDPNETKSFVTSVVSQSGSILGNRRWQIAAALVEGDYCFDVAHSEVSNRFSLDVYKRLDSRCIKL